MDAHNEYTLNLAFTIFNDDDARLTVCKAGRKHKHLHLLETEAHPCTDDKCFCSINFLHLNAKIFAARPDMYANNNDQPVVRRRARQH